MALIFPKSPTAGQQFPQPGDTAGLERTGGVVYQYDNITNSWNIVGPDNVATTDWVKAQFKDDSTALDKAYDLIASTNDITIDADYAYKKSDSEADTNLESGIRGSVIQDGNDYEEYLDTYLTEWEIANSDLNIPGGYTLTVAGIDYQKVEDQDDSTSLYTTKFKDIVDILVSEYDKGYIETNKLVNYDKDCGVGDTIELEFLGSDGNYIYSIYKLVGKVNIPGTKYWGLRVKFEGGSHPDSPFSGTSSLTYYKLKFFKKAFTSEGGELSGPLHIILDHESALMVKEKDEAAPSLFNIDTINRQITTNDIYDAELDYVGPSAKPGHSLVTLSHINRRLGTEDPTSNIGPYLRILGGTLKGRLIIDPENGTGTRTFVIRGKRGDSNSNGNLLFVHRTTNQPDDIVLFGRGVHNQALLNKEQIEALVGNVAGDFLPKKSPTVSSGPLTLAQDPSNNMHATTMQWVENLPVVPKDYTGKSNPTKPGELWSKNGTLYWNKR